MTCNTKEDDLTTLDWIKPYTRYSSHTLVSKWQSYIKNMLIDNRVCTDQKCQTKSTSHNIGDHLPYGLRCDDILQWFDYEYNIRIGLVMGKPDRRGTSGWNYWSFSSTRSMLFISCHECNITFTCDQLTSASLEEHTRPGIFKHIVSELCESKKLHGLYDTNELDLHILMHYQKLMPLGDLEAFVKSKEVAKEIQEIERDENIE